MKILIVTPAGRGSRMGNRVTALRQASLLRYLGHEVRVRSAYEDLGQDLLIALHAEKSAAAIAESKAGRPSAPVVLVLTGTDIYGDIEGNPTTQRSIADADRLVVLQANAALRVPVALRAKARVILQSARPPATPRTPDPAHFDVCVLGHLRPVKNPLLAARAARRLPDSSRVRIVHLGGALDEEGRLEAQAEAATNPRYRWLGSRPRREALQILASCRALVLTSHDEGGPSAVTEALACGLPVLSTRIPAALGLLGDDHPGLFPRSDEQALAELLSRLEEDSEFRASLTARSEALRESADPCREAEDLRALLAEFGIGEESAR